MSKAALVKKATLISIGNEILAGRTVDTNAAYLGAKLLGVGIPMVSGFTVGDDVEAIVKALEQAADQADIVLVTGGLGPTDDDVTRHALAKFMGAELVLDEEMLGNIEAFFAGRDMEMPFKNKVQAYIPLGAKPLINKVGTAPGITAEYDDRLFVCLPGVPIEMERMFTGSVLDGLREMGAGQVVITKRIKCFGAGESSIAGMLGNLMDRGRNPLVNCTASRGVITLHIVATASDKDAAEAMIEKDSDMLCGLLGELVYGFDDETLAEVVGKGLAGSGKRIAVAESCTGGLLAKMLTDAAGASEYFIAGWVTYSNEAKVEQLGVDEGLIAKHGAVSEQVAIAMAKGARKRAGSDVGIGITGIAGPSGASEQKPVGLVYIALAIGEREFVEKRVFSHSRAFIRYRAALTALNILRKELKI